MECAEVRLERDWDLRDEIDPIDEIAAGLEGEELLRGTKQLEGNFFFGGVSRAPAISHRAVVSYTTFSPLPIIADRRYILCGTFRQRALKRAPHMYSRLPGLRGAVSYGVRTFLFEFPQSDSPSL